jgi:hypothetical protein
MPEDLRIYTHKKKKKKKKLSARRGAFLWEQQS